MPFEVIAPEVDETPVAGETPHACASRLSLAKARAVAALHPAAWVIGSDQTATLDGASIVGKPGNQPCAREQLRAAAGRVMTFHTGLALVRQDRSHAQVRVIDTRVRLRPLDDATIDDYLAREQPYDCAGSAKVEALGIALMQAVEGSDPTALEGLPLIALTTLLNEAGLAPLTRTAAP